MVAIDISYAQGFPNYDKLATNIDLIIARAGTLEGGGMLQDSKLVYNRDNARRLGKQFGTYLFNGPVDPVKAADWYLSIIDWRPGDLMAIDVESPNTWGPSQVLAFLGRVKDKTGVVPATYGSTSVLFQSQWKQVSDFGSPLWAANYGVNNGWPGRDPGNGPWARRILWQYTSTAQHSGFSGSVDTNQINDAELAAYLGTTDQGEEDMQATDTYTVKDLDGKDVDYNLVSFTQYTLQNLEQVKRDVRNLPQSILAGFTAPSNVDGKPANLFGLANADLAEAVAQGKRLAALEDAVGKIATALNVKL